MGLNETRADSLSEPGDLPHLKNDSFAENKEKSKMPRKVFIFDTTLRDGEQSPGASLNASEKMEIAKQLARLKVDIIEAGNPISSLEDFEAVEAIANEVKGPTICALARCVSADIEKAGEAVKGAEKPMVHVYIGVSDIHMSGQLRKTDSR